MTSQRPAACVVGITPTMLRTSSLSDVVAKTSPAERLLLELVDATEEESRLRGTGVAPWYYEQLAIIYRKRKDPSAEVAILERYARQPPAPGAGAAKLAERLAKARALCSQD